MRSSNGPILQRESHSLFAQLCERNLRTEEARRIAEKITRMTWRAENLLTATRPGGSPIISDMACYNHAPLLSSAPRAVLERRPHVYRHLSGTPPRYPAADARHSLMRPTPVVLFERRPHVQRSSFGAHVHHPAAAVVQHLPACRPRGSLPPHHVPFLGLSGRCDRYMR